MPQRPPITGDDWNILEPFQPFIYSKFRDCWLGLPFTTLYWNHCIKFGQSLLSRHWGLKWKPGMAWHNSDGTFKVKCAESTLMTCFDVFWCVLPRVLPVFCFSSADFPGQSCDQNWCFCWWIRLCHLCGSLGVVSREGKFILSRWDAGNTWKLFVETHDHSPEVRRRQNCWARSPTRHARARLPGYGETKGTVRNALQMLMAGIV